MSDVARFNPTGRFSGLADVYAKHRPDYPAAAIDQIIAQCGLTGAALLVDVGCGTGISTRQFAKRGINVIGVEPNDDMRAQAARETHALPARYVKGTAEATGLADGCATAVLAAQSFHWFDAAAALREFHRILRPAGWVNLMWNEREETDPCTAAFGAVVRTGPDAAAIEGPYLRSANPLLQSPSFVEKHTLLFSHEQALDEEGLLGRAFSASYAPREPAAAEVFAAKLREVFARFQQEGRVVLRYKTEVYCAKRAG